MKKLRIVFLGTPEFAAHCLKQLINDGTNIVGVVTSPDRKKGRGQKVSMSAVKECALENNLPIFQPTNLKDASFITDLSAINPDIGVVVAFRMLPKSVWNLPKMGTINLHASLLPNYRGAAPINWVLINGEKKTGLTTFFLKHEIDTGDIIRAKEIDIDSEINAGELHDVLMIEGGYLLAKSLSLIQHNQVKLSPQIELVHNKHNLKQAPKLFKDMCEINWNQPSKVVHNFIRGLSPYPGAWSTLLTDSHKDLMFKVYRSEVTKIPSQAPKTLQVDDDNFLLIGTRDTYIRIIELQIEGKRKMESTAFNNGFPISRTSIK